MNLSFTRESEKIDSNRQTLTEKELVQAGQEITKNTERPETILFARESSADFLCFQFWLHLFRWLQRLISGCFDFLLLLLWIIIPTSLARKLPFFFFFSFCSTYKEKNNWCYNSLRLTERLGGKLQRHFIWKNVAWMKNKKLKPHVWSKCALTNGSQRIINSQ